MPAIMSYTAFAFHTGAAFLNVNAPMTADHAAWGQPTEVIAASTVWSDRAYKFKFPVVPSNIIAVGEKQSLVLHNALIASFDEFTAPIAI